VQRAVSASRTADVARIDNVEQFGNLICRRQRQNFRSQRRIDVFIQQDRAGIGDAVAKTAPALLMAGNVELNVRRQQALCGIPARSLLAWRIRNVSC
jgi:hypothetical protein